MLRHLFLLRPAVHGTEAHIVLGNAVVRHCVKVFLGVILLDQAAVRTHGIARVEVVVVGHHNLAVGA